MAKVYTLYSNGTQNSGWFVTNSFTPNNIQSIVTDGKDAAKLLSNTFHSPNDLFTITLNLRQTGHTTN